jgi:hypothetical protein
MAPTVPAPRASRAYERERVIRWYLDTLGWPVREGMPPRLAAGVRFDVLEMPAEAGREVLRRTRTGPAALSADGTRLWLLVAAGSADEVPGLLDWLEWGGVALDLRVLGAGASVRAPAPPHWPRNTARGAAVWLRPPECEQDVEPTLPVFAPFGGRQGAGTGGIGGAPDLVRLLDTAANECHRVRLSRVITPGSNGQPLAFS